ncbi:hypothetical protein JGS22_014950 [Streptomyces sp. P38-E01]|uniref:Uncharacterized protein n=1 Tax=Streptomyces tardus TaxID=2780544 RepID=A0A949JF45_9ACTN|nr:hypothetical protein [Streptomyces tardus]MBU7598877.1 hypothetical protein [Streptomyces tardus]
MGTPRLAGLTAPTDTTEPLDLESPLPKNYFAPAEHLLRLASDFTRAQDTYAQQVFLEPDIASRMVTQADTASSLAQDTYNVMASLNDQPVLYSPEIEAVYARVTQFTQLTISAASRLNDAAEMMDHAYQKLAPGRGEALTELEEYHEAVHNFTVARNLTAFVAPDALETADLFVRERRRRGIVPEYRPPALSASQLTTLRAVAGGEVAMYRDKPRTRRTDVRVGTSTVRALESRGLVTREECPAWAADERLHLTRSGRRDLAASFGRSRPAATARTAAPAPKPANGHSR